MLVTLALMGVETDGSQELTEAKHKLPVQRETLSQGSKGKMIQ